MKSFYPLLNNLSILFTSILAGFTLAGAFACNVSPDSSALFPFISLLLPGLLLINLAVAIYWTVRWRYWVFIPLISILVNWQYMSCIFQFPLFTSSSQPMVNIPAYTPGILTVATYNVDSFRRESSGYTCKNIAGFMKDISADILCFQEFGINSYFNMDSLKIAFAEWPYSYVPAAPNGENLLQLAVFSRYPISNEQLITYPESNNCSLWCDIEINGRIIRLFNNHLQTTEVTRNRNKLVKELQKDDTERTTRALFRLAESLDNNFRKRAAQANVIGQLIATSPHSTLVCGDFNSLPSSYTYDKMKGGKLKDGFQTCGHGYMYTFRYFKHLLRIDYIFHSPELQGEDFFSPNIDFSDHNPVVMRMKW